MIRRCRRAALDRPVSSQFCCIILRSGPGRFLEYINGLVPAGFDGEWVIYAARSRFERTKLSKLGITFHQLPYELATWF